MASFFVQLIAAMCMAVLVFADVSHILDHHGHDDHHHIEEPITPAPPPRPYVFSYSSGRTQDTIDRTHTEVSDGSGVVRGAFSYVDPRNEVRTVQYVADENGFHPKLSHAVVDTEANQRATAQHIKLYNQIAEAHAHPEQSQQQALAAAASIGSVHDTEAVMRAKDKHFTLFEKIAQQHAQIGAERELERLAFEATSEQNQLAEEEHGINEHQHHHQY